MAATATKPKDSRPFLQRVADPRPLLDRAGALTHYRALAHAIDADHGCEGDPEFVGHVLDSLGLTLNDLASDVGLLAQHREMLASLAEYDEPAAQKQLAALVAERDQLTARLATVRGDLVSLENRLSSHAQAKLRLHVFPTNHVRLFADPEKALRAMFPPVQPTVDYTTVPGSGAYQATIR